MPRFSAETRILRIESLINRLKSGHEVSLRDFTLALSLKQRKAYKALWKEQKDIRDYLKNKPAEITEYERKLNKALLANGRYEAYVGPKHTHDERIKLKNLGIKAESLFEDALENFEELLSFDPSLRIWFDRDIVFGVHGTVGTTPEQMPRVITSKSYENLNKDGARNNFGLKTKSEIKIDVLEQTLAEFKLDMASDDEQVKTKQVEQEQSLKLKELMKGIKGQNRL